MILSEGRFRSRDDFFRYIENKGWCDDGYIDMRRGELERVLDMDPTADGTGIGKYSEWLVRQCIDYSIEERADTDDDNISNYYRSVLEMFDDMSRRGILKRFGISNNIFSYKSIKEVDDAVKEAMSQNKGYNPYMERYYKMEGSGGVKYMKECGDYVLFDITSFEANRLLGTHNWCTVRHRNTYNSYTADGTHIYMICRMDENGEPTFDVYGGEKYEFNEDHGELYIRDENDNYPYELPWEVRSLIEYALPDIYKCNDNTKKFLMDLFKMYDVYYMQGEAFNEDESFFVYQPKYDRYGYMDEEGESIGVVWLGIDGSLDICQIRDGIEIPASNIHVDDVYTCRDLAEFCERTNLPEIIERWGWSDGRRSRPDKDRFLFKKDIDNQNFH